MAEQSKPKNETATTNETVQASPDRPKSFPTKVRVTQFPDRELEVDESEWNNLAAQGLLVSQNKE
jgi:hypothetical protein